MKKKISATGILLFLAIACIVAEVLLGGFEYSNLPAYENYYVLEGNCYSKGKSLNPMKVFKGRDLPYQAEVGVTSPMKVFREKDLSYKAEMGITSPSSSFSLDQDKLDTTAYRVLAEYCEANDYAVDEYKIAAYVHGNGEIVEIGKETEPEYRMIDGKLYVRCIVIGTCLDYGREDKGETWRDYELHKREVRGSELNNPPLFDFYSIAGKEWEEWIPILQRPLNDSQPTNVCSICLTLYVCIQD